MDKINDLPNWLKVIVIVIILPIFASAVIFFTKVNEYYVLQDEYDIYQETQRKEIERLDLMDVKIEQEIKDISNKVDIKTSDLSKELNQKFNTLDSKIDKIYNILINMQQKEK